MLKQGRKKRVGDFPARLACLSCRLSEIWTGAAFPVAPQRKAATGLLPLLGCFDFARFFSSSCCEVVVSLNAFVGLRDGRGVQDARTLDGTETAGGGEKQEKGRGANRRAGKKNCGVDQSVDDKQRVE